MREGEEGKETECNEAEEAHETIGDGGSIGDEPKEDEAADGSAESIHKEETREGDEARDKDDPREADDAKGKDTEGETS
jgi:hypothetical protein